MSENFNETPTLSNSIEAITAANALTAKTLQAIATETTEYSKKSFEKSRVHFEKLVGVKKIDEAIQLQSDFAKSAYEDFVAEAIKIGEMYSDFAKEALAATQNRFACTANGLCSPDKCVGHREAGISFPLSTVKVKASRRHSGAAFKCGSGK